MMRRSHPYPFSLQQLALWLGLALLVMPLVQPQPGLSQTRELTKAEALRDQGLKLVKQEQFPAAIQAFQQALVLFRQAKDLRNVDRVLADLVRAYGRTANWPAALETQQQRIELTRQQGDRFREALLLKAFGNTHICLKNYEQAIVAYQRSSQLVTGDLRQDSLSELGHTLIRIGKFSQAETTLRAALAIPSDTTAPTSRAVFQDLGDSLQIEQQRQIEQSLQQAFVAQNKWQAALEVAEQGRARSLIRLLASRTNGTVPQPASIDLNRLKQIAATQKATLVEYSILYDRFPFECISDTESHQAWKRKATLLIWVIKPTGEVAFRTVDLAPLLQRENTTFPGLIFKLRNAIGVSRYPVPVVDPTQPSPTLSETNYAQLFYQILIQPIAGLLPKQDEERVIVIPDGMLFYVPFPALMDPQGTYLIRRHTLSIANSIQILDLSRQNQQRRTGGRGALVVGNPSPMPMELQALPGTELEAKAIAQLLKTQPLLGTAATKQTILQQMQQAKIIHLATHGLFNDRFGEYSALAVAAPETTRGFGFADLLMNRPGVSLNLRFPSGSLTLPDNGLISAEEIFSLSAYGMRAELAVLSACDTGLGELTGDGIVGLSRALIAAGIPTVIVSLWTIPDAPTAYLMVNFYQQLPQAPDKATALRRAMLATMQKYPRPRSWALLP